MSGGIKISDLLRPFDGTGDVVQWLTKLELVAELREIRDVAKTLPLFLEGAAFAVYNELDSERKGSAASIKEALEKAFSTNPFQAYEQLCRRVWRDEPVDVYMTDLRRLARLAGITSDVMLLRAFVVGLPPTVSRELRALPDVDKLPLSSVVERARCLVAELVESPVVAVAQGGQRRAGCVPLSDVPGGPKRCYRCGGPHLMKFCRSPPGPVVCWSCGQEGHIAKQCEGNETGRAGAPAALLQKD